MTSTTTEKKPTKRENYSRLQAVLWHSLAKASEKEAKATRGELADGSAAAVRLEITGEIDGQAVEQLVLAGSLTVGYETTQASSSGPSQQHLLALVLKKLPKRTRDKILQELPNEFRENGGVLPAVNDDKLLEDTGFLLMRLRDRKEQTYRGAVRFQQSQSSDDRSDA